MIDQYIYLHGFASSPASKKATRFRLEFEKKGMPLVIPDLEGGNFEKLTISSQIEIVQKYLAGQSQQFGLIGSSMGGYLAVLLAQMYKNVAALYLMAPAFNFVERWQARLQKEFSDKIDIPDLIEVFNYRYNEKRLINTNLLADARKWPVTLNDHIVPMRIVHGLNDDTVDIRESRNFVSSRPWCQLCELESDHGLLSHIDWIVDDCVKFFKQVK